MRVTRSGARDAVKFQGVGGGVDVLGRDCAQLGHSERLGIIHVVVLEIDHRAEERRVLRNRDLAAGRVRRVEHAHQVERFGIGLCVAGVRAGLVKRRILADGQAEEPLPPFRRPLGVLAFAARSLPVVVGRDGRRDHDGQEGRQTDDRPPHVRLSRIHAFPLTKFITVNLLDPVQGRRRATIHYYPLFLTTQADKLLTVCSPLYVCAGAGPAPLRAAGRRRRRRRHGVKARRRGNLRFTFAPRPYARAGLRCSTMSSARAVMAPFISGWVRIYSCPAAIPANRASATCSAAMPDAMASWSSR